MFNFIVKILTEPNQKTIVYRTKDFETAKIFLQKTYDYYQRPALGTIEELDSTGKVINVWSGNALNSSDFKKIV